MQNELLYHEIDLGSGFARVHTKPGETHEWDKSAAAKVAATSSDRNELLAVVDVVAIFLRRVAVPAGDTSNQTNS